VTRAAHAGAALVVLPELFATGASWTSVMAEKIDGPTMAFLRSVSADSGAWVCGSVAIRHESGTIANTVAIAGPDGTLHLSEKHHLSAGRESELFTSSHKLHTFTIDDLRVTPFVGHDIRFPQDFWDAARDTDLFIIPGAEPESRRRQWSVLLAARAIENQCYVIGVNRVGGGGGVSYAGDSAIIDPQGEVLASGAGTEALLIAEVDSALVRFTRDRRPLLSERQLDLITLN